MPSGHVIHFYIYDTGGDVDLGTVGTIADEHPFFEELEIRKTAPKYVNLPRPLTVRFPTQTLMTSVGPVVAEISARIFALGAVSIAIRFPFTVPEIADLVDWGTIRVARETAPAAAGPSVAADPPVAAMPGSDRGAAGATAPASGPEFQSLETVARARYDSLMGTLRSSLRDTYVVQVEPEPYVVYALTDAGASPDALLADHRRPLAGLLAGERDWKRLATEEVEDNLRYWFRYFADDLAIVDWDYALLVEPSGKYEDVLYILELANLQLLELRTYDRYLDDVLEKAYDDLDDFHARGGLFKSARDIQRHLSEIRVDLSRVTEAAENMAKIFGDYYLGKLHAGAVKRFHIADWERTVQGKLAALNDLYAVATHEVEHRRALLLESAIVLLFVLDIIFIIFWK